MKCSKISNLCNFAQVSYFVHFLQKKIDFVCDLELGHSELGHITKGAHGLIMDGVKCQLNYCEIKIRQSTWKFC